MTRKQAFLVLLLGLLVLAARQHIRWPSRFWESPSFEVVDWEILLGGFKTKKPQDQMELFSDPEISEPPESPEEPEPAPPPPETPRKKVESPPPKEGIKKPPSGSKAPEPSASMRVESPRQEANPPEPERIPLSLSQFPEDVVERISSCWEFASSQHQKKRGQIAIEFTHDTNGYLRDVRVVRDTLGIQVMETCVVGTIGDGNTRFQSVNPNDAGKLLFEMRITFELGKRPS